jgi:amphi-Trp domain-containing protein
MELIELADERRLSREQAAAWLHALADSLARHNEIEFVRDGLRFRIEVPDQVTMEVEVEIETGESGIEIEITW